MFGERLKKLRLEADLKQSDLAKIFGLSTSSIGMYEQGRRTADPETLLKISKYFNVSVDYLLGNTDERNKTDDNKNTSKIIFKDAQEAMEFILKQPSLMAFGVPNLSDDEIIEFANDILEHIEFMSYKYKNKNK